MTWDEAVAFALGQDGAELSTSYRQPAVKVNGHTVLGVGHEPDTSFVLHAGMASKAILMEACPDTFWETPHYAGHGAVLVRYDGPDEETARDAVVTACERARAAKPPRRRDAPRVAGR